MTIYADYTPEEQLALRHAIRGAAVAVSAASPGRKEETVSEGFAAAEFVLKSQPQHVRNTLLTSILVELQAEVAAEQAFPDYVETAAAPDAFDAAMSALRAGRALLDEKATPEEAADLKSWMLEIARVTAQAGKEDQGFLGMGGVLVNDTERAALQGVAEALGLDPLEA